MTWIWGLPLVAITPEMHGLVCMCKRGWLSGCYSSQNAAVASYLFGEVLPLKCGLFKEDSREFLGHQLPNILSRIWREIGTKKVQKIGRNSREIKSWRLKNIISSFYFSSLIFILVIFMGCFYNFIEYFYNMLGKIHVG